MKRGKAKLLTEIDIKNCLRCIDDMPNGERNRAMFEFMLNTALRVHSVQKLTIGQVYDEGLVPRDSFLLQPEQNKGHKKSLQVYINDRLRKELLSVPVKQRRLSVKATDHLYVQAGV